MPDVKLKFEGDNLVPEDDDISGRYLLGRQVAHEYHSSAVQSYIDAESAALQVRQEAEMSEMDKFRREQTKKQAEGKAAASSFAASMRGQPAQNYGPAPPLGLSHDPSKPPTINTNPKDERLISEETGIRQDQMGKGEKLVSDLTASQREEKFKDFRLVSEPAKQGKKMVAAEGGGGGWGVEDAPAGMPDTERIIEQETTNQLEDPMIDPVPAGAAGAGAAFKLSMSAGKALMPSLARAVSAGVINVATDPVYGTAAEAVGASSPALALPFNIAVGLLGGMTLEPAIERGIARAAAKAGKTMTPEMLREQAQVMKGILANEIGTFGGFNAKSPPAKGAADWFTGMEGKPKFEIDDSKMQITKMKTGGTNKEKYLSDLIEHNDLFENYPHLKDVKVAWRIDPKKPSTAISNNREWDESGKYVNTIRFNAKNYEELKDQIVHEVQHQIQVFEDFARGGHPSDINLLSDIDRKKLLELDEKFRKMWEDPGYGKGLIFGGNNVEGVPYDSKAKEMLNLWNERHELIKKKFENYQNLAGEIESRDAANRRTWPMDLRRTMPPDLRKDAIIRMDDLTKAAVIEEINAEIGKHPLDDALRILKNQKGEVVIKQGAEPPVPVEGTPPAPVKGKKPGVPKTTDMAAKADEFTANKSPDITQETAGNIRLWGADLEPKFMGELEKPEDIMRVISGTHEAFADETQLARRGVRSWEETADEAKKYRIEDLLGRNLGQALNAEQIDNARTLLVSSSDTLRGMATLVRSGQANDLQKADFMRAFNTHYAIQMQLSGAAAEAGRALNIFRKVAQSDALRVGQLKEFLGSLSDRKITPETIADALSTMESPAQVANYVKQAKRATTWDMFIEAWINGLLSGPVTHAVNTTSNALTAVWMIPERALAAGISQMHGGEIRGGEVAAQAFGLIHGFKDGLKLAWHALKSGEGSDIVSKIEQQQYRSISAANVKELPAIKKMAPNALEEGGVAARAVDALGELIRGPGRFLTAEDELFKTVGYRMELQAQAFRKASGEGLEGAAMAKRMQEIIADPQNLAPDVHLAAVNASRYQTFTNELGGAGKAVQSFANKAPGAKLVIPFVRTPINIMKFALERNLITAPFFKQVRADIMAGGARRDMALARISLGSMAMGVVASYAASGTITGGGPSDKDLRSHLYNTGWQPYSIKIGDTYYAYGRLEPIGMMMGLAADAVEIMGELNEAEADKIATTIVAAIGKNVMSKTWLRGMSEMIHAMDDPDRYGPNYIKQFAGTAIPTGIAQIERTMYPELSDARTALDAIKSRVPGFSNDLPTRRNVWGEKITFNGALGPDLISPIFTSSEKDSPIDKEILRMAKSGGVTNPAVKMPGRSQSFEGVQIKLDPYEYEEFVVRMNGVKLEATGKTLKKSLDELVTKDRDYKAQKNDDIKNRMIKAYVNEATEKAKAEMLEESQILRLLVDDEHRRRAAAQ